MSMMSPSRVLAGLLLLPVLMIGCRGAERKSPPAALAADPAAHADSTARAAREMEGRATVLFVGTSLTAGLGLDPDDAFPALVQQKIDSAGLPFRTVNAGNSGETAAGARRRVETWLIRQPYDVVVLETGSNDMLRGQAVDSTRASIQAIVDTLRAVRPGVPIVLAGMYALPNLGEAYGRRFHAMYGELAAKNGLTLIPFLLEGVGGRAELNQPDGMHPNEEGERIVAANVWRVLEPVLRRRAAAAAASRPAS
jgi:acyl-CoA thioesterase-1